MELYRKALFIFALVIAGTPPAHAGPWEAMARTEYHMFYESCPATEDSSAQSSDKSAANSENCPVSQAGSLSALEQNKISISPETFLGALADQRAQMDKCASVYAGSLAFTPDNFELFASDVEGKLGEIIKELNQQFALRDRLQQLVIARPKNEAAISSIREAIKNSNSRLTLIDSAIQLGELPSIRSVIRRYIERNLNRPPSADSLNEFRQNLKESLIKSSKDLDSDVALFETGAKTEGKSLDRATRESLAQDRDLVESVLAKDPIVKTQMTSVACEVDRNYGRGAELRDKHLTVGSLALTAVSMGLGLAVDGAAAASAAASTPLRAALARGGLLTLTGARIGVTAVATGIDLVSLAKGIDDSCMSSSTTARVSRSSNTKADLCEDFKIEALPQNNCYLNAALGAAQLALALPPVQNAAIRKFKLINAGYPGDAKFELSAGLKAQGGKVYQNWQAVIADDENGISYSKTIDRAIALGNYDDIVEILANKNNLSIAELRSNIRRSVDFSSMRFPPRNIEFPSEKSASESIDALKSELAQYSGNELERLNSLLATGDQETRETLEYILKNHRYPELLHELRVPSADSLPSLKDRIAALKHEISNINTGRLTSDITKEELKQTGLSRSQLSYSELKPLAGRTKSEDEDLLKTGAFAKTRKTNKGGNDSEFVTLDNGAKGLWKAHVQDDNSNYRAEVLAYEVDRKFGFNLVPPTVERTVNGRKGSLQLFQKGVTRRHGEPDIVEWRKQQLLDFVIDNRDRHIDNYLIGPKGKVISIDNGYSFTGRGDGKAYTFFKKRKDIDALLKTDQGQAIIEKLRSSVGDMEFKAEIEKYLGKEDADRLSRRIEFIVDYFDKLAK